MWIPIPFPSTRRQQDQQLAHVYIHLHPAGLILTAPRLARFRSSLLPALLSLPPLRQISMDVQAELRSVQKPPAKPWRGGSSSAAPPPPPPKVYRVEPREFRDLVQRLTGAPPAAGVVRPQQQHHQVAAVQPVPVRASREQQHQHQHQQQQQQQQQQLYSSPWFSFPLGAVDGANGLM